jgi:probable rRNA maturation factor
VSQTERDDRVTVVVADERSPDDSPHVVVDLDRWRRLARATVDAEGGTGELTLTFVDAAEIAELNEEHMGSAGPTDVLSFPLDDRPPLDVPRGTGDVPRLLGDVVVSPAVAAAQFDSHAGTIEDELALLVVHGVLHVLGHDHAEAPETALMRRRELEVLEAHHWGGAAPAGFRQAHD